MALCWVYTGCSEGDQACISRYVSNFWQNWSKQKVWYFILMFANLLHLEWEGLSTAVEGICFCTLLLNNIIIINHIKVLFNILLSTLTPSVDEVICSKWILCVHLRLMKVHESNGRCISLFIDGEKAYDSGDKYCARHWILCNDEAV